MTRIRDRIASNDWIVPMLITIAFVLFTWGVTTSALQEAEHIQQCQAVVGVEDPVAFELCDDSLRYRNAILGDTE